MKSEFGEMIEKLFDSKKAAVFHFDEIDPSVLVGTVESFNETEVLIAHITEHGCYDGFILQHMESLFQIDEESDYAERMRLLYQLKGQSHPSIFQNVDGKSEILLTLLKFAQKNELIVGFESDGAIQEGLIRSFSDSSIAAEMLDSDGRKNGISRFTLDSVDAFMVDTEDEQDLKLLRDNRERIPGNN